MSKLTPNWEIWLFVIIYFVVLSGTFTIIVLITPFPYIIFIITTLLIFLISKGKLASVKKGDSQSVMSVILVLLMTASLALFAKLHSYNNYVGKHIVSGRMITKTITVEADEGPNSWEERRSFWIPNTKGGETVMKLIQYFNIGLPIISIILSLYFYSKSEFVEDEMKSKKIKYF